MEDRSLVLVGQLSAMGVAEGMAKGQPGTRKRSSQLMVELRAPND